MNSVLRTVAIARPAFVPFDERRATRLYQRNLPHWRQDQVTYFVTFREADSIPEPIRLKWEEEKTLWLKACGILYDGEKGRWHHAFEELSATEQMRFHKHFNRQVQSCLDRGLGQCYLRGSRCMQILRAKILVGDGIRCHMGDFGPIMLTCWSRPYAAKNSR